jgi:hypothetical protein
VIEEQPERVCFALDVAAFSRSHSGRMELRFHTPLAGRVCALLER